MRFVVKFYGRTGGDGVCFGIWSRPKSSQICIIKLFGKKVVKFSSNLSLNFPSNFSPLEYFMNFYTFNNVTNRVGETTS